MRNSLRNSVQHDGFTLLELVVILFIFSLLVALVMPRLTQLYESVQTAYEREEVLNQLGGLSFRVFQQSREFDLISYPPSSIDESQSGMNALLELPAGWQLQTFQPIHFFASGACEGGTVEIQHQKERLRVELKPPLCSPSVVQ